MIDTIALSWECTHCDWTFSADWDMELSLGAVITNCTASHARVSPDCPGELSFGSQFIKARSDT